MKKKIVKIEGIIDNLSMDQVASALDDFQDILDSMHGKFSVLYEEVNFDDWIMEGLNDED